MSRSAFVSCFLHDSAVLAVRTPRLLRASIDRAHLAVRQDGMRRRSNRWMLAALTLMYIVSVVSYAFELISQREYIRQTTGAFTGQDTYDGGLANVVDAGQYVLQDINVGRLSLCLSK